MEKKLSQHLLFPWFEKDGHEPHWLSKGIICENWGEFCAHTLPSHSAHIKQVEKSFDDEGAERILPSETTFQKQAGESPH